MDPAQRILIITEDRTDSQNLREFITGEDQEQICAEAKDQRCLEAPHNFLVNALTLFPIPY